MSNRLESDHNAKLHPETTPTVDNTRNKEKRVGVVEKTPVIRETVTTANSTSHSHPTKSKQELNPGLSILGALACCIPLAGILGYLVHQPKERVVTRTVTQQVPVLVVPASPGVTPSAVSPAPNVASPSPVGPETVGPATVGPAIVGPATVGPETVGPETVGPEPVGPGTVGPAIVGPARVGNK